ncbi:MAG: ABC transporter ATP-binding protein [Candidatus Micrarchaeia archaeon]
MLKVKNINVFYGELQVLYDVSLDIDEGEFCAVIGSNGAGKTTLLKTISGLIKPKNGCIEFNGNRIDKSGTHNIVEQGIALVPEGRMLFYDMSVLENLYVGSYLRNARQKRESRLKEVFELFPILKERKNQIARTLSGGEQQMLAIARALMLKPRLLLIDEPSWGLAPLIVKRIFDLLKHLNEMGLTIMLVEQNVHLALKYADRVYVLENGKIVLEGRSEEIAEKEHIRKAYLGI